ncbi:hypothetical protein M9435_001383 [Picochlorum sp. BPE23]|nr:hypothetical protein M9435_001383 [Picochlorum sp. BPE23]
MGNIQSFSTTSRSGGGLSLKELERLQRRVERLGRGRSELARSDLKSIPELSQNPFMESIFRMYDGDGDGLLELRDVQRLMERLSALVKDQEAQCKFAFDIFDRNGDGCIDKGELVRVLRVTHGGRRMSEEDVDRVAMATLAEHGSEVEIGGVLTFEDFTRLMLSNSTMIMTSAGGGCGQHM